MPFQSKINEVAVSWAYALDNIMARIEGGGGTKGCFTEQSVFFEKCVARQISKIAHIE